MKEVITPILSRLESVDGINHVDINEEQLDNEPSETPFNYPAAFLDLEDIDWRDSSQKNQTGNCVLAVHVAWQTLKDTRKGSPNRTQALVKFDILQAVHAKLQGFSGATFSPLTRTRTSKDKSRGGGIKCYVIRYATTITDDTTTPENLYIENPDLEVTPGSHPATIANETFFDI